MAVDTTATAPPTRPRLTCGISALQRTPTAIQVGLDPRHAVVVDNVPRVVARLLRSLDGTLTLNTLVTRAGKHAPVLGRILDTLMSRGLVTDAGLDVRTTPQRRDLALMGMRLGIPHDVITRRLAQASIVVSGEGELAVAVARLLAACGVGHIDVESSGTVAQSDIGLNYRWDDVGRRRRDAIATAVCTANPTTSTAPMPSDRGPDLLVLTDTLMFPPHRVDQLMGERQPHLLVRFRDGVGVVGPLVLPGRTSCVQCAELHRYDLDRAWPHVTDQLMGRTGRADPATTQVTAALAVGQVLRALQDGGEHPPLWNATLEVDLLTGDVTRRTWLPHPRCTCGAPPG